MSITLSKITKERKTCYLAGDFNINLLQLENNAEVEIFFDMLTNKNFIPLITSPTRITSKSKTLIDNIFFNEFSKNIISGNLTVGISDHIPQFAMIPLNLPKSNTMKKSIGKFKRNYHNINTQYFKNDLDKINWDLTDLDDINQYGNNFLHVFNQILDIHAPLTKVKDSKNFAKRNAKPWITKDILKLFKCKKKYIEDTLKKKVL